jgi:hypothetical protein
VFWDTHRASERYKRQVAKRIKLGSLIAFPLGDGHLSYLHFIGPGIHGDAVRVLEGIYAPALEADLVVELSSRPELFIAQTFVRNVVELPGAQVVAVVDWPAPSEIVPGWISSPIPENFLDRWVIRWSVSSDGKEIRESLRMPDFLKRYPEIDATSLPETAVDGEGVLQKMVRMGWKPAYGNFGKWMRSQEQSDS